jgi:hypothetical protein
MFARSVRLATVARTPLLGFAVALALLLGGAPSTLAAHTKLGASPNAGPKYTHHLRAKYEYPRLSATNLKRPTQNEHPTLIYAC